MKRANRGGYYPSSQSSEGPDANYSSSMRHPLQKEVNELSARSGLPKLQELPGLSSLGEILSDERDTILTGHRADKKMEERLDNLIREFSRALRKNRRDTRTRAARGSAYLEKAKIISKGKLLFFAKTVSDFSIVLRDSNIDSETKGIAKSDKKRARYSQMMTEALYNRGIAYQHLGQMGKAIADFSRVLDLDSQHAHAAFARAACQNIIGKFSQAIEDYELALKNDGLASSSHSHQYSNRNSLGLARFTTLNSPRADPAWNSVAESPKSQAGQDHDMSSISDSISNTTQATSKSILRRIVSPHDITTGNISLSPRRRYKGHTPSSIVKKLSNDVSTRSNEKHKHRRTKSSPFKSSVKNHNSTPTKINSSSHNNDSSKPLLASSNNSRTADELCKSGGKRSKKGKLAEALKLYEEAIRLEPKHFKAHFNRGYALYKLGRFQEATEAYTVAVRINPSSCLTFYNRGISRNKAGDIVGAIADFTLAIRSKHQLLRQVNHKTKLSEIEIIVSFHHNRGILYTKLKEFAHATDDYSMVLELNPKHVRAMINRAKCMFELRRFQDALVDYNAALKVAVDPSYRINALMGRAQVHQQLSDLPSALKDTDEAMRLIGKTAEKPAPASATNPYRRSRKKKGSGEREGRTTGSSSNGIVRRRIDNLTDAIEKDRGNYVLYYLRGKEHARAHEDNSAVSDFTTALEIADDSKTHIGMDPQVTQVHILLARAAALQRRGDLDNALSDLSLILRQAPSHLEALNARAFVLVSQGLYRLAIQDYKTLYRLNPKDTDALFNTAVCLENLSETSLAVEIYTKAINQSPSYAAAHLNRGLLLEKLGKIARSRKDLRRAEELGALMTRTKRI